MFKNLKLGPKLLTIGIVLTVVPLIVLGAATYTPVSYTHLRAHETRR